MIKKFKIIIILNYNLNQTKSDELYQTVSYTLNPTISNKLTLRLNSSPQISKKWIFNGNFSISKNSDHLLFWNSKIIFYFTNNTQFLITGFSLIKFDSGILI